MLHITSLPSEYGIGDLGPEAYKFVDFLVKSKQQYWQVLPLNYTMPRTAYSPYNCFSAFAGNTMLISPRFLYRDGLLSKDELKGKPAFSKNRADYGKAAAYKEKLFGSVFSRMRSRFISKGYEKFKAENVFWLEDFAMFVSIRKKLYKHGWHTWPRRLRDRKGSEMAEIRENLKEEIERQSFLQYLFYRQWDELRRYCHQSGIRIIGDMPIYVAYDGPDVWTHARFFKLDRSKKPKFIAGVPPDYFSKTGQLWGNPVYDWKVLKKTGYRWWMERIKQNMKIFDLVRIDHFRGLIAYWQISAGHKTAKNGKWAAGPKDDFFKVLLRRFPSAPVIAEDLGYITDDVKNVIEKYDIPTMKVLQFAFTGDPSVNQHIPHNHIENCIVYTGTHDNNTTKGWFVREVTRAQKKRLSEYIGQKVSSGQVNWQLIRLAMSSVARLSIIPVQDLLGLPESARMNCPGLNKKSNWLWRLSPGELNATVAGKLRKLTQIYARD